MNPITANAWNCPICIEVMDGDNQRDVAISKRCFHVFHDRCIKPWLEEHGSSCPMCKLPNFSKVEIIPNPDYVKQYNLWKADPENYSNEKDLLRPEMLRGLNRREDFTREEAIEYCFEVGRQIKALKSDSSKEKINRLILDRNRSEKLVLVAEELVLEKIRKSHVEIRKSHVVIRSHLDRMRFADSLIKKAEDFYTRVDKKVDELRRRSFFEVYQKCQILDDLKVEILKYRGSVANNYAEKSGEELLDPSSPAKLKEQLREIDTKFEAFIEGQPETIKNFVRGLALDFNIPEDEEIPIPEDPFRNDPFVYAEPDPNALPHPMVNISLMALAVFALYKMATSKPVTNRIWKLWKNDIKGS